MLNNWFKTEVEEHFYQYDRLVLVDPGGQYKFLVDWLEDHGQYEIFRVTKSFDDLAAKYKIEKNEENDPVLIYSLLDQEELRYCSEYAETDSAPENLKKSLSRFIQSKTDLSDADLHPSDFVMLGRQSIGRGFVVVHVTKWSGRACRTKK